MHGHCKVWGNQCRTCGAKTIEGAAGFFFEITVMHLVLLSKRGGRLGSTSPIQITTYQQRPSINTISFSHLRHNTQSGLGTAFFYLLSASFFYVLLKNTTFFYVLFSCFWRLMKPKRTMRFFTFLSKERKRTQRRQHSFAKNVKERREHSVLLQRM